MEQHSNKKNQYIHELHAKENKDGNSGQRGAEQILISFTVIRDTFQCASVTEEVLITNWWHFGNLLNKGVALESNENILDVF